MAEWWIERGIGESRAALIHDGHILEARIELPQCRFHREHEERHRDEGLGHDDGRGGERDLPLEEAPEPLPEEPVASEGEQQGDAGVGTITALNYTRTLESPENQSFVVNYVKRYKRIPTAYAEYS